VLRSRSDFRVHGAGERRDERHGCVGLCSPDETRLPSKSSGTSERRDKPSAQANSSRQCWSVS